MIMKWESNDVCYELTDKTFKKLSRNPLEMTKVDGTPFIWERRWNHERITNEWRALKLVAEQTNIPVPRVLDYGINPDGTRYLMTERIAGVSLSDLRNSGCGNHKESCNCLHQAESNALAFIEGTVLPELKKLRSRERGIDGFVMPPGWLDENDAPWKDRGPWRTYPILQDDYVFQHGDLSAGNIMLNPVTFQVTALIDWEQAGYFPPGMELWKGTLAHSVYIHRGDDVAGAIKQYLSEEYIDCCKQWKNQKELAKKIKEGKLPQWEAGG